MQKQTDPIAELEALVGKPRVVTVIIEEVDGDANVTVSPEKVLVQKIRVGDIPKVVKAAGPLAYMLSKQSASKDEDLKVTVQSLMLTNPDEILNLLAALTGKDREFIDKLNPDDAIMLAVALVEVNLSFFVRRVLPALSGEMGRLLQGLKGAMESLGHKQPKS